MAKIVVLANNSSDAISGNILDVLETLDGVKGYKGDVTITDDVTLEQLTKLNKATTGAITLSLPVDFVGTSTEILTAIAGDIISTGNIVITNNNYTLAQLNAISKAGTIELSNASVALSGSVDDLKVLGGISNYAGAITVTGKPSLDDLIDIAEYTTGKINVANKSVELEGAAADLAAMLPNLAGYKGAVTVTDTITLAQLKAINNATTGAITLAEDQSAETLSGSAADILAAFKGIKSYEGNIEVTGNDYKLADLKAINAINAITDGTFTVETPIALSGSAKDLAAALKGVVAGAYTGKVTVTGSYTVAELKAINDAVTDGDVVLANKKVALTGTVDDIKAALVGIEDYTGAIKLTDVPDNTAELIYVADLTKGKITLPANGHIDLEGTAAELQSLLAKINGAYKGDVTVSELDNTNAVKALAQLKAINDATTGKVEVTDASALEGSIKDIHAALKGITGFDAAVKVTDTKYTLAQLKTIVDSGVDSIVLDVNAPLSGSVADLKTVFAVATGYKGAITVTGNYNLDNLNEIAAFATGKINVANKSVALSGDADELAAMLPTLAGYKGAVTVTDELDNLEQLIAINNGTTGKITLAVQTGDLSGSASDILAAFKGIKSYAKGNITVDGTDYKLADLKAINAITTDGDLIVTKAIALTGNAKDLAAALDGVAYGDKVTVTGSYTVADLKTINTAVTTLGDVVLANKKVALTGKIADIKDALDGILDYEGAIKLTDSSIDKDDLIAINNLTKGKITLPANGHDDLAGDVTTVTNALQGVTGYKGTVTVTVDGGTTLAQLQTILKSTVVKAKFDISGTNTTENTTLEGTAKEITAVLNKFSTKYAGDLEVTGKYTLADLVALNKLLDDATADITLDNTINLSGKSADIAAALKNVNGYEGKITLTDKPTVDQLVAINAATSEAIKIPTDTALTGTAADIIAALNGVEGHKGNITVSGTPTAAQVNTIAGLTTGVVKATILAGAVKATLDAIAKVDANDIITFEANDISVDASDLVALKAKVDNLTTPNVTTITEAAANIGTSAATIKAALAIAPNKAVTIIDGNISAADLDSIANATNGKVTANISAGTVAATLAAISHVDSNDIITYTTNQATVDASDLVALKAKVNTFNTASVTKITETAASVSIVDDALGILGADTQTTAVEITGAIAAGDLNTIATKTAGVVTATITDGAVAATLAAITNVNASDAITFTTNEATVDASDLVALKAKVDNLTTTSVNTITEAHDNASLTTVVLDAEALATGANVEITGGAISAAHLNTLASDATIGNITATITEGAVKATLDAITNVNAADTITFKTTDTSVDASDLVALKVKVDTFDTTNVTTITEVAGQVGSNGQNVVDALTIAGGDAAVTITGGISAGSVAAINSATNGLVTVTDVTVDTVGAFDLLSALKGTDADLSGITGLTTIDATDTAASAISLNLADLLAVNDTAVNANGAIAVNLGAGDTLNLSGWTAEASVVNGNGTYTHANGTGTYTVTVTGADNSDAVVIA